MVKAANRNIKPTRKIKKNKIIIVIIIVFMILVGFYHYLIFFLGPGFEGKTVKSFLKYNTNKLDHNQITFSFVCLGHIRNHEIHGNELIDIFNKLKKNQTIEANKIFCDLYDKEINNINNLKPDFVFITGDLMPLITKNPFWKEIRNIENEMKLFNLFWDQIYKELSNIEAQVVIIPGNHEIYSNSSREIFKEKVGPLYYSFEFKDSRFIILNSIKSENDNSEKDTRMHTRADKPGKISKDQLEFLSTGFAAEWAEKQIFIFTHFDPFDIPNWWDDVSPIIKNTNCKAVFSGTRSGTLGYEFIDSISYFDGGFDKEGIIPSYYVLTTVYENNDIKYNIYHSNYNMLTAINITWHNWRKIFKVLEKIIYNKH